MKLKRSPSTEARINKLLSKDEPSSVGLPELSQMDLALLLNWYNQYQERSHAQKYLMAYCKEHGLAVTESQVHAQAATLGFVCRIIARGGILPKADLSWLEKRLHHMTHYITTNTVSESKVRPVVTKPVTIQDRLKEQSSTCMAALEEAIDHFILSDFKTLPNTLEIMRTNDLKGAHGPNVVNFFKKGLDEYRVAIEGKDKDVNEAYSNYTVPQMKRMEALYDQIISDTLTIMGESRKPRAKKIKSPESQVKRLKFCPEDKAYKIKSINPRTIIGAQALWSYHTESRMLTVYYAKDADGLGIKGCAVLNYSPTKSRTRKLRKPEEVLPGIVAGSRTRLRGVLDALTTKDGKVTGRLGSNILLIKVQTDI